MTTKTLGKKNFSILKQSKFSLILFSSVKPSNKLIKFISRKYLSRKLINLETYQGGFDINSYDIFDQISNEILIIINRN